MKALKHLSGQPFVVIVGIAALIHSTWTVATFSGGVGPNIDSRDAGAVVLTVMAWLWWVLPGFLAAFALEVGQVVTAQQIKRGVGRKLHVWRLAINLKILTFVLMSAATYVLQLAYLLHHYPALPVALGLPERDIPAANTLMEIIIWGMPLLLPVTMLFATASDENDQRPTEALRSLSLPISAKCPDCEWCGEYNDPVAAQNALNGHRRIHSLLPLTSSNGKH